MINVKFLTGSKNGIDNEIAANRIDAGDVILTSDTDEFVFINPNSEKRVIKSKTQKPYTLRGTDLGGLKDGTTIAEGISIDELLELITTKVIPATYEKPIITLVNGGDAQYEVGTSISTLLQSQFIQNDAGALTEHNILRNGEVIHEGGAEFLTGASDSIIISEEPIIFESKATYGAGEIKNNNLDEASPEGAISAGEIISEPIVYQGYRNLFFGKGTGEIPDLTSENIRGLENTILNPKDKMKFSVSMNAGEQYVIFAYPSSLEDVEQITYVQMNDTEMAPNFTKTLVEIEGANGYQAIEYKVYTYKTDVPVASKVTFEIII